MFYLYLLKNDQQYIDNIILSIPASSNIAAVKKPHKSSCDIKSAFVMTPISADKSCDVKLSDMLSRWRFVQAQRSMLLV